MDEHQQSAAEQLKIIIFSLAGEHFGIALDCVREIALLPEITAVPSMPAWLLGVVNLRGEVIPVVSLALAMGMGQTAASGTKMIVAEIGGRPIGIVVEGVPRIDRADSSSIEPAPDLIASRMKRDFITGVIKDAHGLVILLDLTAIVRVDEIDQANQEG